METDVFVMGGGPGGLAAAIAARRKGFAVMLADGAAPPIDKACGEGLLPGTQAALGKLGIQLPADAGYRFTGIRFVDGATRVCAKFPVGEGIGIRRTTLHGELVRAAGGCGVELLWKTPVVGVAGSEVQLQGGSVSTRWIVGADGARSRVRRWSGLDATVKNSHRVACRRHYRVRPWSEFMEIYWGKGMQAYVTPVGNEEVCIVTVAETMEDANFERMLRVAPELRERLAGAELRSKERGAVTAMESLRRVCRGNVALVGDASGGVDAITGDGLRLGFQQAAALAEAMERNDLSEYERVHRRLRRGPLWMGRLMLEFGRREGIRKRLLCAWRRHPELFGRLLAIQVGPATSGEAIAIGAQMGWQMFMG